MLAWSPARLEQFGLCLTVHVATSYVAEVTIIRILTFEGQNTFA